MRRLNIFISFILALYMVMQITVYSHAASTTPSVRPVNISGKVSLPSGAVAPKGGIKVAVSNGAFIQNIVIEEGSNSANYMLNGKYENYNVSRSNTVYYTLEGDYGYADKGYYSKTGTTIIPPGKDMDGYLKDIQSDVNLELIPCTSFICGSVFLPEGMNADIGDEHIRIEACSRFNTYRFYKDVIIPQGKNSQNFQFSVAPNIDYELSYTYTSPPKSSYETTGTYHKNYDTYVKVKNEKVKDMNIGIIHKTSNKSNYAKRALTFYEYTEVKLKTRPGLIDVEPSLNGNTLKLAISSDELNQLDSITSKSYYPSDTFKLRGYNLYCFKTTLKDAKLVAFFSKGSGEIKTNLSSEGAFNYYIEAVFENNLKSSISNIISIEYYKNLAEIFPGSSLMKVKGCLYQADPDIFKTPVTINGQVFMPINSLVEALGGKAAYDSKTGKLTIELNNNRIEVSSNSNKALVNNVPKVLPAAPQLSGQKLIVPVKSIFESLGYKVTTDSAKKALYIN